MVGKDWERVGEDFQRGDLGKGGGPLGESGGGLGVDEACLRRLGEDWGGGLADDRRRV